MPDVSSIVAAPREHWGAATLTPMASESAPSHVEIAGKSYPSLADGKYDVIVLGTGLKECIVAGLLAVEGKKVRACPQIPGPSLLHEALYYHAQ